MQAIIMNILDELSSYPVEDKDLHIEVRQKFEELIYQNPIYSKTKKELSFSRDISDIFDNAQGKVFTMPSAFEKIWKRKKQAKKASGPCDSKETHKMGSLRLVQVGN